LGPCENNRECVQCEIFGGKNKNCDCDIKTTIVDRIDDYDNEYKKCQFVDQTDNCTFFFSYSKSNDKLVKVQKTKGIIKFLLDFFRKYSNYC
jgi:hypothetical protein